MRFSAAIITVCAALLPVAVRAQTAARRASPADSLVIEARMFRALFDSIPLTDTRRKDAQRLIHDENQAQYRLTGSLCEKWPKRIALNAKRDSSLRALLATHADSTRFSAHARKLAPEELGPCLCKPAP